MVLNYKRTSLRSVRRIVLSIFSSSIFLLPLEPLAELLMSTLQFLKQSLKQSEPSRIHEKMSDSDYVALYIAFVGQKGR